ncbi:hypothetical protein [Endozoicomonas euniceicola]|uniref:Uncharacterized protein n=1 Tax=Endozoicomonas euniceicola TaxID=1234143 RepID=A0ABY6GVK4_9GAMM|nr:hypothetical protein [Endozoicomonas euniceicola]UYM16797.1 hypothetical protein NX720_02400 [Endozoicomonas euniceicola]
MNKLVTIDCSVMIMRDTLKTLMTLTGVVVILFIIVVGINLWL